MIAADRSGGFGRGVRCWSVPPLFLVPGLEGLPCFWVGVGSRSASHLVPLVGSHAFAPDRSVVCDPGTDR